MSRHGKVIVAMSGGVDSSVAACLLKEQGYECVGVFMCAGLGQPAPTASRAVGADGLPQRRLRHGCCSERDALDARATAGRLGIPFYTLSFAQDFDRITDYFVDEYARGRTPNPCVVCNTQLKFGRLLEYADAIDAEFVATGHYARVLRREGQARLARSLNRAKDQSYVLFGIRRADLPRCLFPLGEIGEKAEVRRIAAELGLRVHDKPESQEICFVPDNDYRRVVRERRPETVRPGEIRDSSGKVLGTHDGIASYTIGQRRGLGIAVGKPVYVVRLDVPGNTVTVGPREELLSSGLVAEQVNWLTDPPSKPVSAEIKIRYTHTPASGSIRALSADPQTPAGQSSALPEGFALPQSAASPPVVEATFDQPQLAVAPGQAAVFYDDGVVLGGGWIREAIQNS